MTTITDVDHFVVANPWKPWAFVRVQTDEGVEGFGEATLPRKPETIQTAIEELSHRYVGKDPFDTERFRLELYRTEGGMMPHRVTMAVMSAIDMACWDIKGKLLGEPIHRLLGGNVQGESIRTYANGWYTEAGGTPAGFADAAERVVADGYDALKFDPFGAAWLRMDRPGRNRALEIVAAIREAVGPDVDLLIEGHYRFTPGVAIELAHDLADFDVTWFEQPTPPDNLRALQRVAEASPIPIAIDRTPEGGVDAAILSSGIDIVQPDLIYVGGITQGKKIAGMAEAEHVSFAPHNANGPISTAACAHVDASTPNFMIQEIFADYAYLDWADDLLVDSMTVEEGRLRVPTEPGLGVELDLDAVREHTYDPADADEILDLFEKDWETRSLTDR